MLGRCSWCRCCFWQHHTNTLPAAPRRAAGGHEQPVPAAAAHHRFLFCPQCGDEPHGGPGAHCRHGESVHSCSLYWGKGGCSSLLEAAGTLKTRTNSHNTTQLIAHTANTHPAGDRGDTGQQAHRPWLVYVCLHPLLNGRRRLHHVALPSGQPRAGPRRR